MKFKIDENLPVYCSVRTSHLTVASGLQSLTLTGIRDAPIPTQREDSGCKKYLRILIYFLIFQLLNRFSDYR